MEQKICFVVMGYGVKTDYSTGRELDLNQTYYNVIKPAVEAAGLNCVRADDVKHSGTIDVPMYEYLLKSDVVIADLSTYNSNAMYELGVRHALRPFTTILIAESKFQNPFDLGHTVVRSYEHLGKDIGYSEAIRFQKELKEAIEHILENPKTDSPVFTFLPDLQGGEIRQVELPIPDETSTNTLSKIAEQAQKALDEHNFVGAKELFRMAHEMDTTNPYFVQRLVLATYKSKIPNEVDALWEAHKLLESLTPALSTDPETLGLAGAINKRLWERLSDRSYLDNSIENYERGYLIKRDYYNGINFAYLLNVRGAVSSGNDKVTDYVLANRVRKKVVEICRSLVAKGLEERSDKYWILATLEEAYFGLHSNAEYEVSKGHALQAVMHSWERETTEAQIEKLRKLLEASPI